MDQKRFDDLTKIASSEVSRRSALKLLVGGAAGAVLSGLGFRGASASPPEHVGLPSQARPPHGGGDCCPPDHPRLCGLTCIDPSTDPNNCGGCGVTCTENQSCEAGVCVGEPCPTGQMLCDDVCIDLNTDPLNCGTCGNDCAFGEVCDGGVCTRIGCEVGLTDCGGNCVDLITDRQHCGACGLVCGVGEICQAGECVPAGCPDGTTLCNDVCVDLNTDVANCGACGATCDDGNPCTAHACVNGVCQHIPMGAGTACITSDSAPGTCDGTGECVADGPQCEPGQTMTCGIGRCEVVVTCQENGTMPPCVPNPPQTEVCNGLDDNCDGVVDNVDPSNLQSDPNNCGACGNVCGVGENCVAGVCVESDDDPCDEIDCNDGIDCTVDFCDQGACSHVPDDSLCEDPGECMQGICDPQQGCVTVFASDGTVCSVGVCSAGVCVAA